MSSLSHFGQTILWNNVNLDRWYHECARDSGRTESASILKTKANKRGSGRRGAGNLPHVGLDSPGRQRNRLSESHDLPGSGFRVRCIQPGSATSPLDRLSLLARLGHTGCLSSSGCKPRFVATRRHLHKCGKRSMLEGSFTLLPDRSRKTRNAAQGQ
jgi:hypothetical protein